MRRHFGIGYFQAEHDLPAWEVQMLLEQLAADEYADPNDDAVEVDVGPVDPAAPFGAVPEGILRMKGGG